MDKKHYFAVGRAIRATQGDALAEIIFKEWVAYENNHPGIHIALQHYVQRNYPAVFKLARAYARLQGWI